MDDFDQRTAYYCGGFFLFVIIVIGGIIIYNAIALSRFKAKQMEKARNKCKEYIDLACSFTSHHIGARIVNGERAPPGMFPHQVSVTYVLKSNHSVASGCGGSIVSERFILTAAHCIQNSKLFLGISRIGTLDYYELNATLIKYFKKVHIHPEYTDGTPFIGDLALIELENNLEFSSDVRPICLNTKFQEHYDSMIATGWGLTETGNASKYLNMVELHRTKETDSYCQKYFKGRTSQGYFNARGICLAQRKGIHKGDSGGPLQVRIPNKCNNTENTWEEIGITSAIDMSHKYERRNLVVQLFVKVEYFVPWIASTVWPDES